MKQLTNMSILELKAAVYDVMAEIQRYKQLLNEINEQIAIKSQQEIQNANKEAEEKQQEQPKKASSSKETSTKK